MSGDGYTGKAIQDISGITYTEISILFIHVLFTQATSSNCQRLALTLLVLNKVTNHHAQQNRVNTVSVTGVCAPRQRNASPFSFGTRLCFSARVVLGCCTLSWRGCVCTEPFCSCHHRPQTPTLVGK